MKNVEQRLEQLEKQLKWYKNLNTISLIAVLALILLGAGIIQEDIKHVVKARKFELVNDNGKTLLTMERGETSGRVTLYNIDGQEVLYFGADGKGDGGLLQMTNKKGENLIQLRTNLEGAALKMYNESDKNVVYIGEHRQHDGVGYVNVADNGKPKVVLDGTKGKIYVADEESSTGLRFLE